MAVTAVQTPALILRSASLRESDRLVELFTKEFGRIQAVAKSAREERSKLRFALEPFSMSDITLVRGRDVWRVRGAAQLESFYRELRGEPLKRELCANVVTLLSRLLAGEERNAALFDQVVEAFQTLSMQAFSAEEVRSYEVIMVLRILSHLGYKLPEASLQPYLSGSITTHMCGQLGAQRARVIRSINEALAQTQL